MPLSFLVVGSETEAQRAARRADVGAASDETYAETLHALVAGCRCEFASCIEAPAPALREIRRHDAVFFAGSPIEMHIDTEETRQATTFMRAVFASGVPSFGSCAGLQIAVTAVGGAVKPREPQMAAAFARGIVATSVGQAHPMLAGRPVAWDAPAMHFDEVEHLPPSGRILAGSRTTEVQAVEIIYDGGVFWGVQYHPELTLAEIAASVRRQRKELVEAGLAADAAAVDAYADVVEGLDREPDRKDLAWRLGIDREITDPERRMTELRNFIANLAVLRTAPAADGEAAEGMTVA